MIKLEKCPIEVAFYRTAIGKKWTLTILRDLILGFDQFSQILRNNPGLSSKVLSQRLKELVDENIIFKRISNSSPIEIKYGLTKKGAELNKVLYELSVFGSKYYPKSVFGEINVTFEEVVEFFGRGFKLPTSELDFNRNLKPKVFPIAV